MRGLFKRKISDRIIIKSLKGMLFSISMYTAVSEINWYFVKKRRKQNAIEYLKILEAEELDDLEFFDKFERPGGYEEYLKIVEAQEAEELEKRKKLEEREELKE